jgi:UDP-N-acetylmuramyl pentapeptide phosphotransferase/UDP-N-acetylglucosamine-1-phosphate transferase
MMLPLIVALLISFMICLALYGSSKFLIGLVRRHDLSAVQSMHTKPTLRLAGVAIFMSIFLTNTIFTDGHDLLSILLLCSIPLLTLGLLEDLGVHQPPSRRLISSVVAGAIFIAVTGTYLQYPGTLLLNWVFEYWLIAVFFTLFITSGIVNAFNLIDGLNGLSGSVSLVAATGIAAVSYNAGISHIALPAAVICGAVIGFMLLNFPFGRIFLGDAGAYGIGFILSWMSLDVLMEAPEVSPWAMLMMFFWPFADTTLTMSRRLMSGLPLGQPDRLHFHQVVMRIIEISFLGRGGRRYSNPLATIVVLPLMSLPPLLGVLFADNNFMSAMLFCLFIVLFAALYNVLIRLAPRLRRKRTYIRFVQGYPT